MKFMLLLLLISFQGKASPFQFIKSVETTVLKTLKQPTPWRLSNKSGLYLTREIYGAGLSFRQLGMILDVKAITSSGIQAELKVFSGVDRELPIRSLKALFLVEEALKQTRIQTTAAFVKRGEQHVAQIHLTQAEDIQDLVREIDLISTEIATRGRDFDWGWAATPFEQVY